MNPWFFSCATLAVSAIYCIWKVYFRAQQKLQRVIRDRVTYMLWVIANQRRANRAGSRITRREQLRLPRPLHPGLYQTVSCLTVHEAEELLDRLENCGVEERSISYTPAEGYAVHFRSPNTAADAPSNAASEGSPDGRKSAN
jgi:hypothetical protein